MIERTLNGRDESGHSLVTVLSIGLVSTLMIAGLFSTVMPSYNRVTKARSELIQRNVAETALDWAVQQMNATTPSIDPGVNQTSRSTPIPTSVMYNCGVANATGNVIVYRKQPQQPVAGQGGYTGSYLWEDKTFYYGQNGTNGVSSILWRLVEADVTMSGQRKRLRAILKPNMTTVATQTSTTTTTQVPVTINGAMLMGGGVNFTGNNYETNTYNSNTNANPTTYANDSADIRANGAINIGGGDVGGNAISYASGAGAVSGSGRIYGRARSNGTITVTNVTGNDPSSGPNVAGTQEKLNNADTNNTLTPKLGSMSMTPVTLPSVPSHPVGATQRPPISGNTTLAAGDYYTSSISLSGSAVLTTNGTPTSPVRIWVEGTNASITVAGNGRITNANGKPAALQIFYTGNQQVKVAGNGEFRGILYAPNAEVALKGNGQMYGAVIGNSATLNGGGARGSFHYDAALSNMSLFTAPQTTTTTVSSTANQFSRYTVVSWQEVPENYQSQ
ncbi:MAG: hypothetical protein K2W95_01595 [Candidatus Obscuribacterales bacterium]|nr:hypothetical protein [Candidatus Obscuribacterales bacterium]